MIPFSPFFCSVLGASLFLAGAIFIMVGFLAWKLGHVRCGIWMRQTGLGTVIISVFVLLFGLILAIVMSQST
jgi:hypothetical protein